MTISLCAFVKNEEACIGNMIQSVKYYVDEINLVDTGSTDRTIELAHDALFDIDFPIKLTVHKMEFTNFGDIRTKTGHLANCDWILMLDADEILSHPEMLRKVMQQDSKAFAFPRRRWLDRKMTKQTELEAYPDWQVRFYRNDKSFAWKRELHEYFDGTAVHHFSAGPVIEHFHDVYKTPEKLAEREDLYDRLSGGRHRVNPYWFNQ